ncbi:hypothetical protein [Microbacterium pumilum]|uniref:PH domain-containing protein n=1 Tax=Microbacterium pumilum TaxID=344165 RepID=A0ABN2SN86_9MICO
MTQQGALAVMIAAAVVLIGVIAWAWRRHTKRDAGALVHPTELPAAASVIATFETLYVATTKHELPLERIAAPGLAFRSRAGITVSDAGIAIDLTGQPRIVLTADRIVDVGQSTVVIDRVVEAGGLTRVTWRTDAQTVVDSYFRPQDVSAKALADAMAGILIPTQTGSDA